MPWETSTRRFRLPPDWAEIRVRIFERDKYRCQWIVNEYPREICGKVATDVDHKQAGDCHDDANLQALCRPHHNIKSGREGRAIQLARQRKIKQQFARPQEKHPGLL